MCVRVAVSSIASSSWAAVTVTVWAVFQFVVVNLGPESLRVRSVPVTPATATSTSPFG